MVLVSGVPCRQLIYKTIYQTDSYLYNMLNKSSRTSANKPAFEWRNDHLKTTT